MGSAARLRPFLLGRGHRQNSRVSRFPRCSPRFRDRRSGGPKRQRSSRQETSPSGLVHFVQEASCSGCLPFVAFTAMVCPFFMLNDLSRFWESGCRAWHALPAQGRGCQGPGESRQSFWVTSHASPFRQKGPQLKPRKMLRLDVSAPRRVRFSARSGMFAHESSLWMPRRRCPSSRVLPGPPR